MILNFKFQIENLDLMDYQELIDRYSPFIKQNSIPIFLGFLGLIFFGYGLIVLLGASSSSNSISFEEGNDNSEILKTKEIVVDIQGAVIKPGVYRLSSEARVSDALIAASGLAAEADRTWLAKNMNMAAKLNDGAKIYIPSKEESIMGTKSITGTTGVTSNAGVMAGGLVNVNSASGQELEALPGVGTVTAEKIISNRPYNSIDDLLNKKIVGKKVFEQIKNKITVY